MMTKTIQINLHVVFVQELAGRRPALHRSEVLAPSRSARILFKSFFFCAAVVGVEGKVQFNIRAGGWELIYHTDFGTTLGRHACRARCLAIIVHVRDVLASDCCCKHF